MADLTTLAAVKAFRGVTGTAQDDLIEVMIPRVSAAIESYVGRSLAEADYSEGYNGTGGPALQLRQSPVVSVSSVSIDGVAVPEAEAFAGTGWRVDGRLVILAGYRFAPGWRNVVVAYRAGYATIPADIEQAAIESIWLGIDRRSNIAVSSKSLAGESITYVSSELPRSAREVLALYRSPM